MRYRALDETGLFGYGCRHEFPGRFINLKHGERWVLAKFKIQGYCIFDLTCSLCYGVFVLEKILEQHPDNNVYIMYDIACTMKKHLKVKFFI